MTVAVITDSAAALPEEVAAAHGITVVPLGLTIGGVSVREAAVDVEELIARFDEGVTTSGPPPGDFAKAIEEARGPEGVVVVTLASDLSTTWRSATLGAEEAGGVGGDGAGRDGAAGDAGPIRVIDSQTAAGAEALIALAAARKAASGGSIDEVVAAAERARENVRLIGALSTLDYIVKGGHIPAAAGWAARRFNVWPVIELGSGRVRPHRPAFSRMAALDRILDHWRRSRRGDRLHVIAMHSVGAGDAELLLSRVEAEVTPEWSLVSGFGTSLVAHTGPSLVGLAWLWE